MAWKPAINLAELQHKKRETVVIEGQKVLLIWHNEQVHALQSQCPHFKLPLSKAEITRDSSIVCPFHKSEFDLSSGKVKCWSPWPRAVGKLLGKVVKPKNLKIYPTQIEEGEVLVEL